jgi:hypothetical protein
MKSLCFFLIKKLRGLISTAPGQECYQQVIAGFENRDIDILVGTQMITKGLDFDHVVGNY